MDTKNITKNLISLLITWTVWVVPIGIYALLRKDIPGTDLNLAFEKDVLIGFVLISSILLGTIHWLLNRLTDHHLIRSMSLILIFTLRFFSFFFILLIWDFLDIMTILDESYGNLPKQFAGDFLVSANFTGPMLYILFIDTIYGWFYQVRLIIGKNIFRNLLLGKYRTPKTESRIFMFIDMKDSTTHAEHMGHIRFTRLIQACFRDFGIIAMKRGVEIYQYVGDEVIVSWLIKPGIFNQNSLRLLFDFTEQLRLNGDEYYDTFGVIPEFKAGAHMGNVTVAEIGLAKRGIEYLSDVLNTAARIQGMCNKHGADLLISGELKGKIEDSLDFKMEFIENAELKGKTEKVELYKVSRTE